MSSTIDFVPARNPRNKKVEGPIIVANSRGEVQAHLGGASGRSSRWLTFEYDFARQGGAVGVITLTDLDGAAATIPDNSILLRTRVETITALTSGGAATVSLGTDAAAAAFLAATGFGSAPFNAVDAIGVAEATSANTKTTAARTATATIAAAALTAGKFRLHVEILAGAA